MGLSVFHAITQSKKPEDFLDLILTAVKNAEWHYDAPSEEKVAGWREAGESPYAGISFQSKQNPSRVAYLVLNRLQSRKSKGTPFEHSELGEPKLIFHNSLLIPLNEWDWKNAEGEFGTHIEPRTEDPGSFYHMLRIPTSVVAHWHPFSKLKPGARKTGKAKDRMYSNVHVEVDEEKLKELEKYRRAALSVSRLLDAVMFKRDPSNPEEFLRKLRFTGTRSASVRETPPLDRFLSVEKSNRPFFEHVAEVVQIRPNGSTADVRRTMDLDQALVDYFGVEQSEFTHALAGKMSRFFKHHENRAKVVEIVERPPRRH
ncbi:MAG: hypothetical protein V1717_01805 [Candidatus Micrarchaeota archaeon]